jgi:hypothetical protein
MKFKEYVLNESEEQKPYTTWDESNYTEDDDLDMAYEDFTNDMDEIIAEYGKKSDNHFNITGKNLGWRNQSGEMNKTIKDWKQLQSEVLPKTNEFTVRAYKNKDNFVLKVSHHDAPTGETYTFTPQKEAEE